MAEEVKKSGYWPEGYDYGEALDVGKREWRYFSPSTLMAADPGTSEGCLRKSYYEKVLKLRGPEQAWQTLGKELHAQNEHYLKTGEKNMGSLALAGLHMLPKPMTVDPRLLVEHEIGGGILAKVPLRAAGVPVVGFIDCIHWQGTNTGTSDITDTMDPPGTIEVIDWKTTSSLKWAKSAQEVSRTLQMTTYGKWAVDVKGAEHVRLSHGIYVTKGRETPRKVSLRVHKDTINKRWEYVEGLASSLVDVVKETNVDKVPANTRACGAFRGCPHAGYCSAASHNSLSSIIGSSFASTLLGLEPESVQTLQESQGTMSLLAKLQATAAKPDAPKPEVASEMRRLALEEVNLKYPGIGETIAALENLGMGMPQLSGEAARTYAIVKDLDFKGDGFAGSGELADFNFEDPGQLADVLAEAKAIVAGRQASGEVTSVTSNPFPEDAPPPLASPPEKVVKAEPVLTAEEAIAVAAGKKPKKPTKKEIEAEKARIAAQQPVPGTPEYRATVPVESTETLASTAESMAEVNLASELGTQIVQSIILDSESKKFDVNEQVMSTPPSPAINLFVDCIPTVEYKSFWPYVNKVTDTLAKEYGGLDYRTCKKDSLAGFGGWKGLLAYGLSRIEIPGGNYLLDNAVTETAGVVVEAMREIVAKSGGMLVRGIR